MTRSVWRKHLKRTGLVLTILMLGVWVFSVLYGAVYVHPGGQREAIYLAYGRIGFFHSPTSSPVWRLNPNYLQLKNCVEKKLPWTTFARHLGFRLPVIDYDEQFTIPVWLLVVATGFPTAILWWRDRRPKAGFCKVCKYDLTGNVSGICPECGTAVSPESG